MAFVDAGQKHTLVQLTQTGAAEQLPRQLDLLEKICTQDSGTGNAAGNATVIALLPPVLAELGTSVERVDAPDLGPRLVARVRPKNPQGRILLAAHLDTVFEAGFAAQYPFRIDRD